MSTKQNKASAVIRNIGLIFLMVIMIFPFYWMIKTSLESNSNIFKFPPSFIAEKADFSSFVNIFTRLPLLQWFYNSLLVSILVTLFSMVISSFAAYSLSRFPSRLNTTIGFLILTTQMFPGTLLLLPIYMIFRSMGLIDSHIGIIIAYTTFSLPVCIWMLKAYFDTVPIEIEESALIDGCSKIGILIKMILPLSLPGFVATSIYTFIQGWDEFVYVFLLLSTKAKWLLSIGLFSLIGEYTTPWNWLMAAATVYTLPAVLLFLFLQRYLVSGVTSGAVKG